MPFHQVQFQKNPNDFKAINFGTKNVPFFPILQIIRDGLPPFHVFTKPYLHVASFAGSLMQLNTSSTSIKGNFLLTFIDFECLLEEKLMKS